MLSIIVSTYRKKYYADLVRSVEETIGKIPYELIPVENAGQFSMCKAYNIGARKAQYPLLCFVHEDVTFRTENWGVVVCEYFEKDENLGALGVAGGNKTSLVTGWASGIPDWDNMHIYQDSRLYSFPDKPAYVNVLDGVLIFTPKKIWNEIVFDESIRGFHFYDLDYTYRVSQKYRVFVTNVLFINHYSKGNFGKDWIDGAIAYHRRKNIFTQKPTDAQKSVIRNFYYNFAQPGMREVGFLYRLKYALALGIDRYSLKQAMKFLFLKE